MRNRNLRLIAELLRPNSSERRSIPVLDGALSPNDGLDDFEVVTDSIVEPEDIVSFAGDRLLVAATGGVYILDGSKVELLASIPGEIISIAVGQRDEIFVGIADVGVVQVYTDGRHDVIFDSVGGEPLRVPTSMAVSSDGQLYVTDSSTLNRWDQRPRDLMSKGASGRLVQLDVDGGKCSELLGGLRWPSGVCIVDATRLIIAESWCHQISTIETGSGRQNVLKSGMAAYPSRISAAPGGRFWLSFWAARNAFVEFVLTEDEFREEMMATIPQEYWVGPALRTSADPWEPLQIGGMKHHNRMKPWAPPRSYGLCARFDYRGVFNISFHARGGSRRHGTTAAIEVAGALHVVSRGGSMILSKQVGS